MNLSIGCDPSRTLEPESKAKTNSPYSHLPPIIKQKITTYCTYRELSRVAQLSTQWLKAAKKTLDFPNQELALLASFVDAAPKTVYKTRSKDFRLFDIRNETLLMSEKKDELLLFNMRTRKRGVRLREPDVRSAHFYATDYFLTVTDQKVSLWKASEKVAKAEACHTEPDFRIRKARVIDNTLALQGSRKESGNCIFKKYRLPDFFPLHCQEGGYWDSLPHEGYFQPQTVVDYSFMYKEIPQNSSSKLRIRRTELTQVTRDLILPNICLTHIQTNVEFPLSYRRMENVLNERIEHAFFSKAGLVLVFFERFKKEYSILFFPSKPVSEKPEPAASRCSIM